MSIHEQARAEAKKRYPLLRPIGYPTYAPEEVDEERQDAFSDGFLAGHEAATRTRVVTTVAELDALPAHAVILDSDGMPWHKPYDNDHGWWRGGPAWSHGTTSGGIVDYGPFRVLYEPEEGR